MFVEIVRLMIVVFLTAAGYRLGGGVGETDMAQLLGATVGAGIGYVLGGVVGRSLSRAMGRLDSRDLAYPAAELLSGAFFAVVFTLVGALMGIPMILALSRDWGIPLAALTTWVGGATGWRLGLSRSRDLFGLVGLTPTTLSSARSLGKEYSDAAALVDSSSVLDGRILEIVQSGLLTGDLLVPRFVLDEIQSIADAQDLQRRRRGRRALELLEVLDRQQNVGVRILEDEVPEVEAVDAKLVTLGRRLGVRLLTADQPLAKVAALQGVECVNLRRLAEGLRPLVVPGDVVDLEIVRAGSDPGQGVGFLADGSLVVVGDAESLVGREVSVRLGKEVTTSRGRMLFATLATVDESGSAAVAARR